MYTITKVLNHNALMVTKENKNYLILDKGIGFKKKVDEVVSVSENSMIYRLNNNDEQAPETDPIYLEITNEIIQLAQKQFPNFDTNILLPLSDHIAFAIERIQKGLRISNPFRDEIRLLNPEEYAIASKARDCILKYTGIDVNDDEVSYITLHIHSAINDCKVDQGMKVALIVQESIYTVKKNLNIEINADSLAYSRLLTHMKYMLKRIETNEKLTLDMDEFILNQYPTAYHIAEDIIKDVAFLLQTSIPRIEVGYLALHIQRICEINE